MIRLALLVVLAGQSPVGNWLTRPEYQTQATRTFYVDPTGNNANACTASGTAACATLSGAFAKLPPRIVHAQTINVAAGTYTENPSFNDIDVNAAITVTGPALINATPATGTASGTLTAVTLGAVTILTDSTQSWTVNDLIGQFVTISSVQRIIATNTATTMTLASPFAANPSIGNSYAIQTPAAIITSATSPTLAMRLTGNSGAGGNGPTVGFTGIEFVNSASNGTACSIGMSNQNVSLTNSKCRTTSGAVGSALTYRGGGQLTTAVAAIVGLGSGLIVTSGSSGSINPMATLNPNNSLFYGAGSSGLATSNAGGGLVFNGSQGWTAQTGSGVSSAFLNATTVRRSSSAAGVPVFRCLALSSSSGYNHVNGTSNNQVCSAEIGLDNLYVDGCTTGVDQSQNVGNGLVVIARSGALTCNNTTTCISVANGSRMRLPTTVTLNGVTTAIVIDGVSYTLANLTSASPPRLPSLAPSLTGSTVWQ